MRETGEIKTVNTELKKMRLKKCRKKEGNP